MILFDEVTTTLAGRGVYKFEMAIINSNLVYTHLRSIHGAGS